MSQEYRSLDSILVFSFFYFFVLLTVYHVGIRLHFFRKIIDRAKELFTFRKTVPRIQKVPPELISTKYNKLSDFLTGRGKLIAFDSSLSLFLSNVTPVILLGIPTTVYLQGSQYFVSLLSFPIAIVFTNLIFVPVFYSLQIKTANQYIGKRFNFDVKVFCLTLVIASNLMRTGIWLNTPHLILKNFTTISSETALILTVAIVVVYTSLGGMEVMQKMERYQLCIMLFSMTNVITKGIAEVGGIFKIIEENDNDDRLKINFDPTPFTNRQTFWSVLSANTFSWCTTFAIQQTTLNRYLPSGSLDTAKRIVYSQIPLMMLFFFAICFIGLLMYSFYYRCDPLMTNRIEHLETLVGLFAEDMTYNRSGLLGLFIVALYSITLSSISSSLNGLSTIVFEDILKFYGLDLNFDLFLRVSMFIFGIIIVITMLVATYLKQSLRLRTMLTSTLIAPVFGVFLLGLHTRRVNSKCALISLIAGLLFGIFVFYLHFSDSDTFLSFGIGFEDCLDFFCFKRAEYCTEDPVTKNKTVTVDKIKFQKEFYRYPFSFDLKLFRYLSYMYDGWLVTVFTVLFGLILSLFIKKPDKDANEIENCLAFYLRKSIMETDFSGAGKTEVDAEYVHTDDKDDKDDTKEESSKDEDKKELNQIDFNYLKKAIDELIKLDKT